MKKSFNYISYCIYSFMPLYFVLLIGSLSNSGHGKK